MKNNNNKDNKDFVQILPVKSDFVFKLIFGDERNTDILREFLKSILDIPEEEYREITVVDPHVKKESAADKYSILDVKVRTKSKQIIHIEIQLKVFDEMKPRVIYGQSKLVTEQMSAGKDYDVIKRAISIVITDENFIDNSPHYHHQFRYRTTDGTEFTNLVEINTLELSKLPENEDIIKKNPELWHWTKFIKSDNSEEVLNMIAERNPQMKKAVGFLKELSVDDETRRMYEAREMARRDNVALMKRARKEGIAEGRQEGRQEGQQEEKISIARSLLKTNLTIDQISQHTGLTPEQIQSLGEIHHIE
ncbi:MAG: Rpn family recombination-promoting nuclease/putative transposase [Defluviitaleaceae bacterium]|nr:Rpn family recombination-promoting nuclease/putative transposase [Defluviitaleaceae bacterium]